MDLLVHRAAQLFGAEGSVAMLATDGALVPVAWVGLHPQLVDADSIPVTSDLQDFVGRFIAPALCRRYMSAGMVAGGKLVGQLVVCSSRRGRLPYSEEDRDLLRLLAHHAAVVVESVRAEDRLSVHEEALAGVAASLVGGKALREVAENAVELAVSELEADAAAVWVARVEEERLELLTSRGYDEETLAPFLMLSFHAPAMAAMAARTRAVQQAGALEQVPHGATLTLRTLRASGMQTALAVPLIARGRIMGVLGLAKRAPGGLDRGGRGLIATLAGLLAAAVFNAQINEESERRLKLAEDLTRKLKAVNDQLVEAGARSRELAELAREKAAELEATLAHIADAVFVCDLTGELRLVNDAGLDLLGVDRGSSPEGNILDHLSPLRVRQVDGEPMQLESLAVTRALGGEVVRGVEELVFDARRQRDRYMVVSASPVRDDEGRPLGVVEVMTDISRLKELDLLKDQFITVAAHEIKTPITAIKGFAQTLLRSGGSPDAHHQRPLEWIVRQADRVDALVRDFLEVSRLKWGASRLARRPFDLVELAGSIVSRMELTTAKHTFKYVPSEPLVVNGDPEALSEVLINLLENSIRYSPSGGEIEVWAARAHGKAVVSVRDEGVGIPERRQSNVFEPFYRAHIGTSLDYGGLGVGLHISREIVRQHGGDMWFESEEGAGSTFHFSVPLAEPGDSPA